MRLRIAVSAVRQNAAQGERANSTLVDENLNQLDHSLLETGQTDRLTDAQAQANHPRSASRL